MQAIRLDRYKEPLLELRKHYQQLLSDSGRKSAIAQEQLTHVNALVVDQLLENQGFVETLMEMRCHYQRIVQECDRVIAHAKEQITHVNALNVDQLVMQHNQPISMTASPIVENENLSLIGAASIGSDQEELREKRAEGAEEAEEAEEAEGVNRAGGAQEAQEAQEAEGVNRVGGAQEASATQGGVSVHKASLDLPLSPPPPPAPSAPSAPSALFSPTPAAVQAESEPSAASSNDTSVNGHLAKSQFPPLKTPMLPQYQHLTKLQAVESLLRENAGTIVHIDWIILALHGELAEDDVRLEKSRMSQTLSDGAKKGLWQKVPGESGCYTLDLKLVDPELAAKANRKDSGSRLRQNKRR